LQFIPNSLILGDDSADEIEAAYADLQSWNIPIEPEIQANLQLLRGRDDYAEDKIEEALVHYQDSLNYWQEPIRLKNNCPKSSQPNYYDQNDHEDTTMRGIILYLMGLCYRRLAEQHGVKNYEYWLKAKNHLEKSIYTFIDATRFDLVAKFINQLGESFRRLDMKHDLWKLALNARQLHQSTEQYSVHLAQDYGFMAEVGLSRQQWHDAKEWAEIALDILKRTPAESEFLRTSVYPQHQGWYLWLLAQAEEQLSNINLAIHHLELAKKSAKPQLDPSLYLDVLEMLQRLYFAQGKYQQAFDIRKESQTIQHQFGYIAFIGPARLRPQLQVLNLPVESIGQVMSIANEIKASGRGEDVNQLIARIKSTQHKLTVIYGPSGVGKSSILTGGLLPELTDQIINARKVKTILLQVYHDWKRELGRQLQVFSPEPENHSATNIDDLVNLLKKQSDNNFYTVLVFDQFEDLLLSELEGLKYEDFFEFLRKGLDVPFVKVILSLRDDYLHKLLEASRVDSMKTNNPEIMADILQKNNLFYMGNFSRQQAKQVIESLTEHSQFYLESALIDHLVADLSQDLGEVRPIELQIVGTQMQRDEIATLSQYEQLGTAPKQKLVERFLEEVIRYCGPENEATAIEVLYLLTDEKLTRPLKSRSELAANLVPESVNNLDLVLYILEESRLLYCWTELPSEPYQLVHDYLVEFIRKKQEAFLSQETEEKSAKTLAELKLLRDRNEKLLKIKEKDEQIKEMEKQRRISLRRSLAGAVFAAIGLFGLAQYAFYHKERAEKAEVNALTSAVDTLATSNDQLKVLKQSMIIAGNLLKKSTEKSLISEPAKENALTNLRTIISQQQEYNRFSGDAEVIQAKFSPNGQMIASTSADGSIKLINLKGETYTFGKQKKKKKDQDQDEFFQIFSIIFSPDNQYLASGYEDSMIRIWTVKGELVKTLIGHEASINSLVYSPDGKFLVSGSSDTKLKLWDVEKGSLIRDINQENSKEIEINAVDISRDGKLIAGAMSDDTPENNFIQIWDFQGNSLRTIPSSDDKWIYDVKFSPDNKKLAAATDGSMIKIWQVETNDPPQILMGHSMDVSSIDFSKDGKMLVSGSDDKTLRLWDLTLGKLIKTWVGYEGATSSVQFSPDDLNIVVTSANHIHLWDIYKTAISTTITGNTDWVYGVTFNPDGTIIGTAVGDAVVRLWNPDGLLLKELLGHDKPVNRISFSPNGNLVASASDDNTVKIWDIKTGKVLKTLLHDDSVIDVDFHPTDSNILVSISQGNKMLIWNIDGKKLDDVKLTKYLKDKEGRVDSLSFRADGKEKAAIVGNHVLIWSEGNDEPKVISQKSKIQDVKFDPAGQLAIATGNQVKIFNNFKQTNVVTLPDDYKDRISTIAFSPNNQKLATATGKEIIIWQKSSDNKYQKLLTLEHSDPIMSIAFSPDSNILAVSGRNSKVNLWIMDRLSLEQLLNSSCTWLQDHLTQEKSNSLLSEEKVCQRK
jgi:WD40 repeat protein